MNPRDRTNRRSRTTLLAVLAFMLAISGVAGAAAAAEPGTEGGDELLVFDLKAFLQTQPNSQLAYDYLKLATALQGIVNRETPKLYYRYESNSIAKSAGVDIDEFWFAELRKEGELLSGKTVTVATSFGQLLDAFEASYAGVVAWDSNVPATSNVASTAAGVDDLLPVRYDATAGSPYDLLVRQRSLPVVLDLVGKFTGEGEIPDIGAPSTGSAKNDAYRWAKAKYLDTGRTNPTMLAYALDGISWDFDAAAKPLNAQWVSAALPKRMKAGSSVDVSVTVKNNGTTAWSYAANDRFGTTGDKANQFGWSNLNGGYSLSPGDQRVFLNSGETVQPGAARTFRFTMTAPSSPGTYTFSAQMVRDGVAYYGTGLRRSIEVTADDVPETPVDEPLVDGTYVYPDLFNSMLPNADYFIANKAFFFDLSPDERSLPNDDRSQPLGTDFNTLRDILRAQNALAGERIVTIGGFVPWWIKYTTHADPQARLHPVAAEWKFADEISKYNAQKDADAYGLVGLSNASVFRHVPLKTLVQPNDKGENGKTYDPNKKYIAFYMGDYDAGAWTAGALPVLWNDPKRGELPLAWAPVPGLSARVPQVFNYLYATATPNDYFVAGDNGAGYLNPMMLLEENRPDGLPDFLHVWEEYNRQQYERHDLDITGFLISGNSGSVSREVQEAYSRFSPAGVGNNAGFEEPIVNGTPFVTVEDVPLGPISTDSAALARVLGDRIQKNQQFSMFRTILFRPSTIVDAVELTKANHPDVEFEIVDPYTFFRFYKEARAWEAASSVYDAAEAAAAIDVDGVVAPGEWDGAGTIEVDAESEDVKEYGTVWGHAGELQAKYKLKWDAENLYILEERTDERFQFTETGAQMYLSDASMLFLDLNGRKFGTAYEAGDYAVLFTASGPDGQPHVFLREGRDGGAAEYPLTAGTAASTVGATSFTFEAAIPWSALQQVPFAPEDGKTIGMSVLATHGPDSWGQIMWAGNGDDQAKWAKLRFAAAPAPSAPTGLAALDVTKTSITVGWSAAPASEGVAEYEIRLDGAVVGTVAAPATTFAIEGLKKDTPYTITVTAKRASGASSAESEPLSAATDHDNGIGTGNNNGNGSDGP